MLYHSDVKPLTDLQGITLEGPIWDSRNEVLYLTDITGARLHRLHWSTKQVETTAVSQKVGFLCLGEQGELYLGMEDGIYRKTERGLIRQNLDAIVGVRFNDGKTDPFGRICGGTLLREGGAHLYRLTENGRLQTLLDDVHVSNGLDWSGDGRTLYYIDTPTHEIRAFSYTERGALQNKRTVWHVPDGMGAPDGMCIDAQGRLWVALWNGGAVVCLEPNSGEIQEKVLLPCPRVSCCAFAGPTLETLMITTASGGSDDTEFSGRLFSVRPGARGLLPHRVHRTQDASK